MPRFGPSHGWAMDPFEFVYSILFGGGCLNYDAAGFSFMVIARRTRNSGVHTLNPAAAFGKI
eukprot:scaffold1436_cov140-Amphora_coffeaeformis.AAC.4